MNDFLLKRIALLLACLSLIFVIGCDLNDDDDDNGGCGGNSLLYGGLGFSAPDNLADPYLFTDVEGGSIIGLFQNQENGTVKSGIFRNGDDIFLIRYSTEGLPIGAYTDKKYYVFSEYQGNSVTVTTYNENQEKSGEKVYSDDIVAELTSSTSLKSVSADDDDIFRLTSLGLKMARAAAGKSSSNLPSLIINTAVRSLDKATLLSNISAYARKYGYDATISHVSSLRTAMEQLLTDCGEYEQGLLGIMRQLNFDQLINEGPADKIKLSTRAIVSLINDVVTIEGSIVFADGEISEGKSIATEVYIGYSPDFMTKQAEKEYTVNSSRIFSYNFRKSSFTAGKIYFTQAHIIIDGVRIKGTITSFKIDGDEPIVGSGNWKATHVFTMHKNKITITLPGMAPIITDEPGSQQTDTFYFDIENDKIIVSGADAVITSSFDGTTLKFEYTQKETIEGVPVTINYVMEGKINAQKTKITGTSAFTMKGSGAISSPYDGASGTMTIDFEGTGTWEAVPTSN